MSRKGYEFVGISNLFQLAGYVKSEGSLRKRYTVLINNTNDDNEGESLVYYDSKEGISIYADSDYSYDEDKSFTNLQKNILRKVRKGSSLDVISLFPLAYLTLPYVYGDESILDHLPSILLWIAFIGIAFSKRIGRMLKGKSYFILQYAESFDSIDNGRLKVYRKPHKWMPYLMTMLLLAIVAISVVLLVIGTDSVLFIASPVAFIGVAMLALSPYFTLIVRNYEMEKGLLVLGVLLAFLGLMFMYSLLGVCIALLIFTIIFM